MYDIVRKGYIKVYRVEADESFSFVSHHLDEAEAISAANNHGEASGGGRYVLSYPNKEVDVGRIVIQGPAPTTAVLTVLPVVGSGSELDVELATPSTGPAAPYTYRLEEAPAAVGPFTTIASGTVFTGSPPRFRRGGLSESATRHYRVIATDSASPARSTLSAVAQGVTHDVTPAAFDFADVSNAAQAALTQSNSITITGITTPVPISVSGGEYRVNSGAWLTAPSTIANGNTVQVRTTSASAPDTSVTVTLTISTLTADWIVRTAATSGLTWPLQAQDGRIHVLPGINIYGSDSYGGSGRNPASTGVNTYIINNGANANIVTDGVAAGFGDDSFQCTLEGFLSHNAGTRSKIGIIARSGIINFDKQIQSVGSNWSLLGQFAPSPGFYCRGLEINARGADHYNVWHMPFFLGNASWVSGVDNRGDGFVMGDPVSGHSTNWIFVNCEFSRSADELFDGFRAFDDVGFLFCAFYEPLGYTDSNGNVVQQVGPLLGAGGGEPLKVSFARCLFANSVDRNPWIGSHRSLSENCIGYNHGRHVTGVGLGWKFNNQWGHSTAQLHNLVRTMFVRGPNNNSTMVSARADLVQNAFPVSSGVFIAGCVQNGWSNPGSQSGFLTNTETNFAVKAAIQTAALPSGRLTSLGDTVAIASNPNSPTAAEKQAFFDLMKISVGANPSYRTTSIGRMQIVLNQIQARLNGTTGEGEQIPTAPTDAAAGGWWTVPVTVVDPLNPGAHWHAPMPTAASRHTPLGSGTFSNGLSAVGYTPMEVWWIEQHYFVGGQPGVTLNQAPVWQSGALSFDLTVGQPFTLDLNSACSDPNGDPITYSIVSGALPAGLTLNDNVVSGTPTTAGNSTPTFRADDSGAEADYLARSTAPGVFYENNFKWRNTAKTQLIANDTDLRASAATLGGTTNTVQWNTVQKLSGNGSLKLHMPASSNQYGSYMIDYGGLAQMNKLVSKSRYYLQFAVYFDSIYRNFYFGPFNTYGGKIAILEAPNASFDTGEVVIRRLPVPGGYIAGYRIPQSSGVTRLFGLNVLSDLAFNNFIDRGGGTVTTTNQLQQRFGVNYGSRDNTTDSDTDIQHSPRIPADTWYVLEVYKDFIGDVVKVWGAPYGSAPELIFGAMDAGLPPAGTLDGGSNPKPMDTGVQLTQYPNAFSNYPSVDTFVGYAEVIASDNPIDFPGGHQLPFPGTQIPTGYPPADTTEE